MYRELKLLADLDLRFHAYHPSALPVEETTFYPGLTQMMKSGDFSAPGKPA